MANYPSTDFMCKVYSDDSTVMYSVPVAEERCAVRCSATTSLYLDFTLLIDSYYPVINTGTRRFYCRQPVELTSISRTIFYMDLPTVLQQQ